MVFFTFTWVIWVTVLYSSIDYQYFTHHWLYVCYTVKCTRREFAEYHLICFRDIDRTVKTHCCQGQQALSHFIQDVQVSSPPWPVLALFLTQHLCWQMSEWSCCNDGERSWKFVMCLVHLRTNAWLAKVLLSGLPRSCGALFTRVSPTHSTHYELPFKKPRPSANLLWPFVQSCFSFFRATPVACWFILANKANGQAELQNAYFKV